MNFLVKIQLKVPKAIKIFLIKNNLLVIVGLNSLKAVKVPNNLLISKKLNSLFLVLRTQEILSSKLYKKTALRLINNVFNSYKKSIYLAGTGYRASLSTVKNFSIVSFKLGYSHTFYIRIPNSIKISIPKPTKLFFIGTDKNKILQIVAFIKSLKVPDSYKGKGFFFEFDKLNLKEGKKV